MDENEEKKDETTEEKAQETKEEYKDTYTEQPKADPEELRRKENKRCANFDSILWPCTAVLYLIYSFLTFGWIYSWVIFLAAAAVSSAYRFAVSKSNTRIRKSALSGLIWETAATLFFVLSFATFRWDLTWIIFLLAIPTSKIISACVFKSEDEDAADAKFRKIGTIIWIVILVAVIVFACILGCRTTSFGRLSRFNDGSHGYSYSESYEMHNDNGRIHTYTSGPVVYRW